jgi:NitT/TauT family transport system permease protein
MTDISAPFTATAPARTSVAGVRGYLPRNPAVTRIIVIVLAVLLWELLGHTVLDPDFLSPPTTILQAMPRVLGNPGVQKALWVTFYELIAGFGLAVILGIIIAVPIGLHHATMRSAMPIILLIFSIPQVTILPLFVLYFGTGAGSKIAFGASHGIFPVILNVVTGVQTVSAMHLTV